MLAPPGPSPTWCSRQDTNLCGETPLDLADTCFWLNLLPTSRSSFCPADIFYKRSVMGNVPTIPRPFDLATLKKEREEEMKAMRATYSKYSPLPKLERGDTVVVQCPKSKEWDTVATILERRQGEGERSYILEFEDGSTSIRNRKHLRRPYIEDEGKDVYFLDRVVSDEFADEWNAVMKKPCLGYKYADTWQRSSPAFRAVYNGSVHSAVGFDLVATIRSFSPNDPPTELQPEQQTDLREDGDYTCPEDDVLDPPHAHAGEAGHHGQ